MKKIIIALISVMVIFLSGCSHVSLSDNNQPEDTPDVSAETEKIENEEVTIQEPDLTQIRSICKLATLECYYHNVAKSTKEAGSGVAHWGESDRQFWTEYTGVVKIGVDMSKGTIDVQGTDVTVYIPDAEIISIKLDSESIQEPITDTDSINKNPIDSDDITGAVDDAQNQISTSIENDSSLLASAQDRAKKLIQNYIDRLGEASGVTFTVHFKPVNNIASSD